MGETVHVWEQEIYENSLLSFQFCYNPEIALKIKVYFKNTWNKYFNYVSTSQNKCYYNYICSERWIYSFYYFLYIYMFIYNT